MSDSTPFIVVLIAVVILVTGAAITLLNREESRYRKLHIAHENLSAWAYSLEECVGQAIVTSDIHGRIQGYNSAAKDLLGFSLEQVRGHSIFELIPPSGNGKTQRFDPAPDSAGRQVQAIRNDGSSIPVLLKVSQTRLGDQTLYRFLFSDLRGTQEQERSQQENYIFRTALDSAGVLVALLSPEGRIVRLSRECADVLEVSPAEAEGNLFWEYFQRKKDWPAAQAYFERAKLEAIPSRIKATWITRTHRPIPLEWLVLKPAWDKNGGLSHIVAVAAPARLRSADDRQHTLRSMERVVGRLAGHFENLLSTINGYSELVLHELETASPLRKDVEQIVAASQRACDTTQQLITFSGQRLTVLEPVDLRSLGKSGIVVDTDPFLSDGPLTVLGNREALAEMVKALAESADRHSDGSIHLKLSQTIITDTRTTLAGELEPGDYLSLRVPLGKSIDAESLAHLFEPFGTTSPAMGLATVYGLVRICGGGISVIGTPDGRSVVEVLLPLTGDEAPNQRAYVKESATHNL
jgi:PAS domain S-box-containing protein